ncbi:MAG TPA: hypothetical protein P5186_15270 [Candidatus Paceibacterota bacterium]|nr:hypothetical protein [Verrucomicrobiota bacterium]HRY49409.1 hypothetical protein [Candidatus Paceibacterota bacterium]HSA02705.1 hypothetical protein [Candidatus Paceibacterota bacterium]
MQTHQTSHHSLRWEIALLTVLFITLMPVRAKSDDLTVNVKCSPAVVFLGAVASGDWLTVHTDLPFSSVNKVLPVLLNEVQADVLKSDNRGNLVAKFKLTDLASVLVPPSATLTLTGTTIAGLSFEGSDTVKVLPAK